MLIAFFRAFSLTFAGADTKRYAYWIFLLPSILFWTADVSKEAIMMLALGLVAYGAAKFLAHRRGGFALALVGVTIGFFVRPNELLMIVAGITVAMMVSQAGRGAAVSAGRRLLSLLFFGSVLIVSIYLTLHYLHGSGGTLGAILTGVFATNLVNDGLKDAKGNLLPLGLVDGHGMQVLYQCGGVLISWVLAILGTLVILKVCDLVFGVRASYEEEREGLDLSMHGEEGYFLES